MTGFSDLAYADGTLQNVDYKAGEATLRFVDWQEKKYRLVFKQVIALESFMPENTELSKAVDDRECDFLQRALNWAEEKKEEYHCYSFWDAWEYDMAVLRVVAKGCEVQAIENEVE